ncbi:helix-hairpin-helix domain-containing protein [Cellulomonas sp. URHB0016]
MQEAALDGITAEGPTAVTKASDPLPPATPGPLATAGPDRDPTPAFDQPVVEGGRTTRTERAWGTARAGYSRSHGHPLDRTPHVVRRRVRWAVPWRLAGAAGIVLLVVAGAVALRAATVAPGAPVALPTPAPDGRSAVRVDPQAAGASVGPVPGPTDGSGASVVPSAQVVVHVAGAVMSPGVVRLPVGSRVVDALASAGGATADADLTSLNLARVLVDGEQVLVLRPGESGPVSAPSAPGAPGAPAGLVDVNTADAAALDDLPGIGPVLAQRIVEHRDERPFATVDELGDVPGIGPTLLERLRALVST